MREEQVTKSILSWLIQANWEIVCFDFPQSGTGKILHPDHSIHEKNKASIIPDIVAVKDNVCVFFENKDRLYYPDFEKMNNLILHNDYSQAIEQLLSNYSIDQIYYGIGLPSVKYLNSSCDFAHLVDFIVGVADDKAVDVLHSKHVIFI